MVRKRMTRIRRRRRPFIRRRRTRKLRVPRRFVGANGTRFFKLKARDDLESSSATIIPDVGVITGGDWANLAATFGFYHVYAIKLEFFPRFNVNEIAASAFRFNEPILVYHDYKIPRDPVTISNVLQRENLKKMPTHRPWKLYYKMRNVMIVPSLGQTVLPRNWQRTATPTETQAVVMLVQANGVVDSPGTLYITYYVGFKMRN